MSLKAGRGGPFTLGQALVRLSRHFHSFVNKPPSMRSITLSFLLSLSLPLLAQEPFERILTMPGALYISGVAMDAEDHFLIASVNEDDVQVTRLSPAGDHVWTNKYPLFTEEGFYGNSIAVGPEGILVAGYTMGLGTNSRDGLLLHIALDGTLISAKRVDTGSSNAFHYLTATPEGFIATGRSDAGGNQYDMTLAKLDQDGTIEWQRSYGTTGWDWAYQAKRLADGGYAMVGYGDGLGTGFSPSGYLVRTDALGNELWARSISSGGGVDEAYTVAESVTGDIYVGGRSLGYFPGDVTAFITKLSSSGTHLWTRVLEQGIETVSLVAGQDGGVTYLAHPQYVEGAAGDYEMAWGEFGPDGVLNNSKLFGGVGSDNGTALFDMGDGSLAVLGFTNLGTSEWSGILIRTDENLDAVCNNLELDLPWTEDEAIVTPFTSLPGSGFNVFNYTMGTESVAVSSFNPCCSVSASYATTNTGYQFTFENTSSGATTYLWDLGDGTESDEESPTHTYAEAGPYTVCLTAFGECGEATTCETISIGVGISEASGAFSVDVYPSPANGSFTVRSSEKPIRTVRMVDAGGREVVRMDRMNAAQVMLPVDGFAAGIYTVCAELSNGRIVRSQVAIDR